MIKICKENKNRDDSNSPRVKLKENRETKTNFMKYNWIIKNNRSSENSFKYWIFWKIERNLKFLGVSEADWRIRLSLHCRRGEKRYSHTQSNLTAVRSLIIGCISSSLKVTKLTGCGYPTFKQEFYHESG